MAVALFVTLMVGVGILGAAWIIRENLREARALCICGHRGDAHVRRFDWDSTFNYGEFKPGRCRKCRCRANIAA